MNERTPPTDAARTKQSLLAEIQTVKSLIHEMEENDKIPEEDRIRMQATLRQRLDDAVTMAVERGYLPAVPGKIAGDGGALID